MAFGRAARREDPPENRLDLSERLAPYGDQDIDVEALTRPPAPRAAGRDVRLVIVDDLPAIRTMMTLAVSLFDGVTIVGEAEGAADAVEVCRRVEPDAILLDVDMPDVDGVQAIPLLKKAAPRAKIAMYSNDDTSRRPSMAAGADAFFLKLTTTPAEVLREIASLVAGA